jgi:putative redox protein
MEAALSRIEIMADLENRAARHAQAIVVGGVADGTLSARAGAAEFAVGGAASGANPYELLSASLAACTAMTIRFHALRRKYPLSHFEVAVSYYRGADGGRDAFERVITLQGKLDETQRAQLMQDVSMSPVGRALGLSADIRTSDSVSDGYDTGRPANYENDLRELSIPNIDPD